MPLTLAPGRFIAVIRRTDWSRRRRALILLQGLALALWRGFLLFFGPRATRGPKVDCRCGSILPPAQQA